MKEGSKTLPCRKSLNVFRRLNQGMKVYQDAYTRGDEEVLPLAASANWIRQ